MIALFVSPVTGGFFAVFRAAPLVVRLVSRVTRGKSRRLEIAALAGIFFRNPLAMQPQRGF